MIRIFEIDNGLLELHAGTLEAPKIFNGIHLKGCHPRMSYLAGDLQEVFIEIAHPCRVTEFPEGVALIEGL